MLQVCLTKKRIKLALQLLLWVKSVEKRIFPLEHPLRQFTWLSTGGSYSSFKKKKMSKSYYLSSMIC